jgi:ketosteroid isomerase-like protein
MTGSSTATRLGTAQQFVMLVGGREFDEAIKLLSPQVSYRVEGNHALSGTFTGRETVKEHLVTLDRRSLGTLETVKWEDWLVGEDHVAAIATVSMSAHGRLYVGRILSLVGFDMADRIVAFTIFFEDEDSALRFFGPKVVPEEPSS